MMHSIVPPFAKSVICVGMGLLLLVVFQPGCKRSTTVAEPKGERGSATKKF